MQPLRQAVWVLLAALSPAWAGPDLAGVPPLIAPGCIPGPLALLSPAAETLIVGQAGGAEVPLAAALENGGRVVALGHGGFLEEAGLAGGGNRAFVERTLAWLAADHARPRLRVAGFPHLATLLREAGHEVVSVTDRETLGDLGGVDVLCMPSSWFSAPEASAGAEHVRAFVEGGGGLLIAGCAWGWQQFNPQHDMREAMGGNRILAPLGLVWVDATARGGAEGYEVAAEPVPLANAARALAALGQALPESERRQAAAALTQAIDAAPAGHPFLARMEALAAERGDALMPSEERPLKAEDALDRAALAWRARRWREQPAEASEASPAAAAFPGAVPAEAERVAVTQVVDTRVPGWHSLGAYAAPGEPVAVTLPEAAAGQGLSVQIGAHTDRLWGLKSWKRVPEITRRWRLISPTQTIASAFGGLIYLVVPDGCKLGEVELTVDGVVAAPHFVLGRTTPDAWRAVRERPAPWAELATDKVVLTVPSSAVRGLDDPQRLMAWWDQVLDAAADLAQRPRQRARPERYVADVQISAGYMHSGYPIMTHLDAAPRMVDPSRLSTQGDWGLFHELGHNHQSKHWTFDGTTEVTVNLFTLYILDRVCGVPVAGGRAFQPKITERMERYLAEGSKFSEWKADPFLALRMYAQLQQGFGWPAFERVFAAYRDAPPETLPRNDGEKRDQWLVRLSSEVGRDLGPFFQRWGVPTSDKARAAVAHLPEWMPAEWGG